MRPRHAAFALLAAVFTVLVQAAMLAVITPFGAPALTASFVLTNRLFLLSNVDLQSRR